MIDFIPAGMQKKWRYKHNIQLFINETATQISAFFYLKWLPSFFAPCMLCCQDRESSGRRRGSYRQFFVVKKSFFMRTHGDCAVCLVASTHAAVPRNVTYCCPDIIQNEANVLLSLLLHYLTKTSRELRLATVKHFL